MFDGTNFNQVIFDLILNTYYLYKGDFSTQYEDIEHDQLMREMYNDTVFLEKIFDAIRGVGLS